MAADDFDLTCDVISELQVNFQAMVGKFAYLHDYRMAFEFFLIGSVVWEITGGDTPPPPIQDAVWLARLQSGGRGQTK